VETAMPPVTLRNFDLGPAGNASELMRRRFGPAPKRMPEIRGIAEAQGLGNVLDCQIGVAQISDGDVPAQFIDQLTKRGIFFAQFSPQRTGADVQVLRDALEARRRMRFVISTCRTFPTKPERRSNSSICAFHKLSTVE
jgi:hypothetical protein